MYNPLHIMIDLEIIKSVTQEPPSTRSGTFIASPTFRSAGTTSTESEEPGESPQCVDTALFESEGGQKSRLFLHLIIRSDLQELMTRGTWEIR